MTIKDNPSKQYRIYIKESKSWVDVNKSHESELHESDQSSLDGDLPNRKRKLCH